MLNKEIEWIRGSSLTARGFFVIRHVIFGKIAKCPGTKTSWRAPTRHLPAGESQRFLFTDCEYCVARAAYIPFLSKKVKKSEIFSELPLANVPENSIIGAVPERRGRNEETEAGNEGKYESPRDFRED